MKTVSSVFTLLMNGIYLSHSIQVDEGTVVRNHTVLTVVSGVGSADAGGIDAGLAGYREGVRADARRRHGQPREGLEVQPHLADVVRHLEGAIHVMQPVQLLYAIEKS